METAEVGERRQEDNTQLATDESTSEMLTAPLKSAGKHRTHHRIYFKNEHEAALYYFMMVYRI